MTDLFLLSGMVILGGLIVRLFMKRASTLLTLCMAFPVGAGVLTLAQFILSWLGVAIFGINAFGILAILIIIFFMLNVLVRIRPVESIGEDANQEDVVRKPRILSWLLGGILVGVFLLSGWLSVMRSFSTWDAMAIWGSKGYGIAFEGSVFAAKEWGALGMAYPLNIPLQIANFRYISYDALPASKLIYPLYFASLILLCVSYWRSWKIRYEFTLLGGLLLATAPFLFEQGTIGYVNLPFTFYLAAGVLISLKGISSGSRQQQFLGSILFGLASWSRAEGILYVLTSMAAIMVSFRIAKRGAVHLIAWILPLGIITSLWFTFSISYGSVGDSHLASAAISAMESFRRGYFNPLGFFQIGKYFIRYALDPGVWGLIFPVCMALVIMRWKRFDFQSDVELLAIGLSAVFVFVVVVTLYYISSFRENPTLIDFLYMAFNRSLIPFTIFLVQFSVGLAGKPVMQKSFKG